MRFSEYFIKHDARRDKTTIRPMGAVVILLVVLLLLGAAFGTWRALTHKVKPVQAQVPAATSAPGQPSDTGNRPVNWPVIKAEDYGGDVVRYALPPEIEQMVYDDFNEAWQWGIDNVLDTDTLETYADVYYTGDWLASRKKKIDTIKEYHRVAIPIKEEKPPYGLPAFQVEGVRADGKTAYIRHTLGARMFAFLNPDGTIDNTQDTIQLPPEQDVYKMVFNDTLRRWQITELVEGPITLPVPAAEGGQ